MGLLVDIPDRSEEGGVLGEQIEGVGAHQEVLAEMETLENWTNIVPGIKNKAKAIAEKVGDESPEFPVVRIEEGWSRSGRLWDGECLEVIAEQINEREPVGHLGHMNEEQLASEFPEPQTVWLGATTKMEPSRLKERAGEKVKVIYAKGYNLPGAKIRTYIKTNAVKGVSWLALGDWRNVPGKGVAVVGKSINLLSLDWARKLSEGMPTSSVLGIASEMNGGTKVGDKALAQVTPEEYKAENPNGYQLLVNEVVAEKDQVIAEQTTKIEDGERAQNLLLEACKAVGIEKPEELLDKITELTTKIGDKAKATTEAALDKLLAQKVPDEDQRAVVKRLLPLPEMVSAVEEAKDEEAADKLLGEMVDKSFNEDDTIKSLLGEQAPVNVRRREELGKEGGKDKDSLEGNQYVRRERVEMS